MENNERDESVVLDFDSVCYDIETVLDDIRTLRTEKLFNQSLGTGAIQKLKDYDAAIRRRIKDAFSMVIVGDFKRGKSTLINSILGKNVAPAAVTPETVTINKISYSQTPRIDAVLKNGKKTSLGASELKREAIEQIMKQLPAKIDYIDIKDDAEILKDITIVDTPGIGDLFKEFDEQVADYLVNADALLYVVSARSPLSLSEQAFLSSSVLPQSFSRVFLVVNMADCLETVDNIEKIKNLTMERAKAINPNIYVYIISALDELCRKKNVSRPEPDIAANLENNYLEFENALKSDIILLKDLIKSTRGIALTKNMLNDIAARILLLQNSLKLNVDKLFSSEEDFQSQNSELLNKIEQHKATLASDIDQMKYEVRDWMYDFMARLKHEIQTIQSTTSVSDLERHFLFYMMDTIKQAIVVSTERHQKDIADKLSIASKAFANEVSIANYGSVNSTISDCITDISWTGVDSAMFVGDVLGLSASFGALYLVGQAVAGFIRQSVVNKKQTDYLGSVLHEFDIITDDVIRKVDDIYEQMKRSAVDKLGELYQSQLELSHDAINQARNIAQNEETKTDEMMEYLDSVLYQIQELKNNLNKYD